MIVKLARGEKLPVYGDGGQIRDWIHVEDHVDALIAVITRGIPGQCYNIGSGDEPSNLELVRLLCGIFDSKRHHSLRAHSAGHARLIRHVPDRPGHDRRYAINASKARQQLGWRPRYDLESGLTATVDWYMDNSEWWERILDGR